MQYYLLGKTDLNISAIGMGCVTFGREIDQESSFTILDHALENGITLFDTAAAYANGASENVLGQWMENRNYRDKIILATKVAIPLTKKKIIASADESLKRLKTDCIDLFQLHSWDENTPLEESMEALNELVESGKVRFIGCSNFSAEQLEESLLISSNKGLARMNSVQPPYNLVQREIESDLLPLCEDQQIGVISYSPLAAGFMTGKYQRGETVPEGTRFDVIPGHQPIYFTDHGFSVLEKLDEISKETGQSMVQLALAWVLNQKRVSSMLIGARNISQVDQVFEAQKLAQSDEFRNVLDQLN
jgi:1-deoxyxylulose-5-phosphate synthase